MYNNTVTVFNRYRSKQLGTTWYPHVLRGCYFNADKGANIEKTGLENADSSKFHVPYYLKDGVEMVGDLKYLTPKKWDEQPNDEYLTTITFLEGVDFFMLGEYPETPVNESEYTEGFFQYMNDTYDDVYRITTVGKYSVIPHFEIGGA